MSELGLGSKVVRRYRITTDSEYNYLIVDNILDREFTQTELGKTYISDITYIAVKEDFFIYFFIYFFNYSNKFIRQKGNRMEFKERYNNVKNTLTAFKMAKKNRPFEEELIFHSDQRVQYANYKFANYLESFNVVEV